MKKKVVAIVSVLVILIITGILFVVLKKDTYVVEIPNADSVTKIVYEAPSGDVYEVKDKAIIEQFIQSIDKMEFKEKQSMKKSTWSFEYVSLYNDSEECVWSIQPMGENGIMVDWYWYESEEKYDLDILSQKGVFIENTHEES